MQCQLYGQVIVSKDEKIAFLENEIRAFHKDRDRIIHLVEKLTGVTVAVAAGS